MSNIAITLKHLKKGNYFVLKDIEEPKEKQVWVRGEYDRGTATYRCYNFSDVNYERFFPVNKIVFIGFTF